MKYFKQLCLFIGSAAAIGAANADNVINDDLIVTFSACVGNDCNNGESFGFDTLRLKENNLRIHFDDTSSSASFPSNDWRLVANDAENGGTSHFSIEDSTAGRLPFRVEAGAAANALVVEADSDVGIGTLNPVVKLHIVDGDSPAIRLEQDGSSGFTPQTWDMASNEANFFIRDVTNGSSLPFRIKPGSGNGDALVIAADGGVGFGTDAPSQAAHIRETSAALTAMLVENVNGTAQNVDLQLKNSAAEWRMRNNTVGQFVINATGDSNFEFALSDTGTLTLEGGLITGTAGNCTAAIPCDRVFDPSVFTVKPIEEHAKEMWNNKFLGAVGPTKPDQPINITQKTTGILHELEVAHIYIEQLHERLKAMEERFADLEKD